jgi:deoxyribonuclease-1
MQKSDMHHLFLSDTNANSRRGNSPFGFVIKDRNEMDESGCKLSRFGFSGSNEVYTPPAAHRGNIARALFYFSMHYNLGIDNKQEATLRQWHKADPIDQNERVRHEKIVKHQKVRNPFIDHPEIIDRISDF